MRTGRWQLSTGPAVENCRADSSAYSDDRLPGWKKPQMLLCCFPQCFTGGHRSSNLGVFWRRSLNWAQYVQHAFLSSKCIPFLLWLMLSRSLKWYRVSNPTVGTSKNKKPITRHKRHWQVNKEFYKKVSFFLKV